MKRFAWVVVLFAVGLSMIGMVVTVLGETSITNPDKLVLAIYGEPTTLDPAVSYTIRGWLVLRNTYDRLMDYDGADTTKFVPRLATHWDVSADGMVWTFYLREDAKFHDGSPVTATAVKYSLDRVLRMNQGPAWMLAQCMNTDSTKVIDNHTVEIALTKPYAAFLSVLSIITASIVNPDLIEAHGGIVDGEENEWASRNDYGSGPYQLGEWIPNDTVALNRFDAYWRGPAPLKQVDVRIVPEVGTEVMLIRRGDADIAYEFPESNIPDLLGAPGVMVEPSASFNIDFVVINCKTGVFQDINLRRALAWTVPYDTLTKYIYQGYAQRLYGPIPEGMFGYTKPETVYTLDLEKAAQVLDSAGYTADTSGTRIDPNTGKPLKFEICVGQGRETAGQSAVMWQNELKKLGINATIRVGTFSVFHNLMRQGEIDLLVAGWYPDYADPDDYTDALVGPSHFWKAYSNDAMNTLVEQIKQETDLAKRAVLCAQAQELAATEVPYIWLAQKKSIVVRRTWVQGFYYNPVMPPDFYAISKGW